jgi:hypothetical protein
MYHRQVLTSFSFHTKGILHGVVTSIAIRFRKEAFPFQNQKPKTQKPFFR